MKVPAPTLKTELCVSSSNTSNSQGARQVLEKEIHFVIKVAAILTSFQDAGENVLKSNSLGIIFHNVGGVCKLAPRLPRPLRGFVICILQLLNSSDSIGTLQGSCTQS